jgi:hypothetical protein
MIKEMVLNFQVEESLPGDTGGRRALGGLGRLRLISLIIRLNSILGTAIATTATTAYSLSHSISSFYLFWYIITIYDYWH